MPQKPRSANWKQVEQQRRQARERYERRPDSGRMGPVCKGAGDRLSQPRPTNSLLGHHPC